MASGPFTSWKIDGETVETVRDFIFGGSKITADGDCSHEIKKSYDKPRRHYFANKGPSSQGYGFSSSHVWMWEVNHKEGWALKNWCFWIMVLEKTLESLGLQGDQISQFYGKSTQIFIGRTDAKAEALVLWPPDVKSWLTGKDPEAGKDWGQKGAREDEMVG